MGFQWQEKNVLWRNIVAAFFVGFVSLYLADIWEVGTIAASFLAVYQGLIRWRRIVWLWVGVASLLPVAHAANNALGRQRGEQVATALLAYHAKFGRDPQRLEELVPAWLPNIPSVKFSLNCHWHYTPGPPRPTFSFLSSPPYGVTAYSFDERRWRK